MLKSCVYQIINLVNGKVYIGSAVDYKRRWRQHRFDLRHNKHGNKHLQRAWNQYDEHNFDFEILQLVKDKKNLISCEQFWVDKTNCNSIDFGYNIRDVVESNLGFVFSEESKKKMSESHKGVKLSEAHRQSLIGRKNTWNKGISMSEETKRKVNESRKGKCVGEDNYCSKLNNIQVRVIRKLLEFGTLTQKQIANIFNIRQTHVSEIKNRKIWKHI